MTLYSKIEGSGKPLLILHGFLGMSDNWKTLGTRYADAGYQVHMLDLRNHGRSFHSEEFTYEAMAQDIVAYCAAHELGIVDIIGHSMGGKVAMFFAAANPQLVGKMIIADIGPRYYRPHHGDILEALNAVDFTAVTSRDEVDEIMKQYVADAGTRQFLMKSMYRKTPSEFAFRFNLDVFNKQIDNVGKALPADTVYEKPVLFIKGGNSRYILEEDYDDISRQFPNARFEIIPDAGHWLHAENPDMFYSISTAFLK